MKRGTIAQAVLLCAVLGGVIGWFLGYAIGSWVLHDCEEMNCLLVGAWAAGAALLGGLAGGILVFIALRRRVPR